MSDISLTLPTEMLPVERIFSDPDFNCRGPIAPFDVIELSRSIEANGLQQPVVVQPISPEEYARLGLPPGRYDWRLVMGHRRHKAFEILQTRDARFKLIPAVVRKDLSAVQARTMNLIENLERRDLTVMQEARALEKFHTAGVPQDEVAKLIGKSRGWVQVRFTALRLPKEIQAEIDAGFISQEQIKDIYSIPSMEAKFEAVREIKEAKLRGDKRALKVKDPTRKRNPWERKVRNQTEIFEMQDRIREAVGNGFPTRLLGWCAGLVTDIEVFQDLRTYAAALGVTYHIPTEFTAAAPAVV